MSDKDNAQDDTLPQAEQMPPDEAPQDAETDDNAQQASPPAKAPASARAALFFALLGLLAAAALAAGGYYLWQQQQQISQQRSQQLRNLQEKIASLQQQQGNQEQQQNEQLSALRDRQSNLNNTLENLLKNRSHLRNDWLLTEAEYLLKLANHRLLLERDVATAIVALQSADTRLQEVADPGLLKIRKRIAADINDLRTVPQPDLAGLSFTLSTLGEDISRLPLETPDPQTKQRQAAQTTTKQVDTWQELPKAIWRDIKSLVVIRHHDDPIQPLLAPEQRFFLIQNLQLQLEQARLALLNGQSRVYQERLQQARQWLQNYFDTEHSTTRQVIERLDELAEKNIHPQLPDISSTHQALQTYRQQRDDNPPTDKPNDNTQQDATSS